LLATRLRHPERGIGGIKSEVFEALRARVVENADRRSLIDCSG
jgi:hypothetical protein